MTEPELKREEEVNGTETPSVERPKRKYFRYSPFSLVLLSICAFVFSFSLMGLMEQALLDTAGSGEIEGVYHLAFGDSVGNTDPSVSGEILPSSSTVGSWQEISPAAIHPRNLPFMMNVDFAALQAENPDTVAWLYWPTTTNVKGLPMNMPVVQTTNNDYYLNRGFDRSYSENGWVYADHRNDLSNLSANRNLILYGHARSYLIFGGLKYLNTKTTWQKDGYNHFLYLNTPTERTVWQVFSWYETTVEFNYIDTYFADDAEYLEFLNLLKEKNTVEAFEDIQFTPDHRILTMSTCKGSDENVRVAVHAVLVKHESLNGDVSTDLEATDSFSGTTSTDGGSASTDGSTPTDTATDTDTPSVDPSVPSGSPDSSDSSASTDGSTPTDTPGTTDTDTPVDTAPPSDGTGSDASSDSTTDGGTPSDTELPSDSSSSGSAPPDPGGSTDSGTPSDTEISSDAPSSPSASTGGSEETQDGGTTVDS